MLSCTSTATSVSYKMGLPQFTCVCTVVTCDGLHFQHSLGAVWDKRKKQLLHTSVGSNESTPLFPRTILCCVAQFLDFDEIHILSMVHMFLREFTKAEMRQLRCLKIGDCCDMSDTFCLMRDAMRNYNSRIFPIVAGNVIKLFGTCRYSDDTLCFLAGMDYIYKANIKRQLDTYRQSHEDRYRHILQKLFGEYLNQKLFRSC